VGTYFTSTSWGSYKTFQQFIQWLVILFLYSSASAIHHYVVLQFFILSSKRVKNYLTCKKTGSTSDVISVSGGTQLGGVIAALYLNGSSSHARLSIVCSGTGVGIGAVGVSTMGAAGVKYGDTGGGTVEASGMPDYTRMASGMAEPTGIVENHAEMAESR
jgi:hypothetical protein